MGILLRPSFPVLRPLSCSLRQRYSATRNGEHPQVPHPSLFLKASALSSRSTRVLQDQTYGQLRPHPGTEHHPATGMPGVVLPRRSRMSPSKFFLPSGQIAHRPKPRTLRLNRARPSQRPQRKAQLGERGKGGTALRIRPPRPHPLATPTHRSSQDVRRVRTVVLAALP